MTFDSEEVRTEFHLLSTETQLSFVRLEEALASFSKYLHVVEAKSESDYSEILIRVYK